MAALNSTVFRDPMRLIFSLVWLLNLMILRPSHTQSTNLHQYPWFQFPPPNLSIFDPYPPNPRIFDQLFLSHEGPVFCLTLLFNLLDLLMFAAWGLTPAHRPLLWRLTRTSKEAEPAPAGPWKFRGFCAIFHFR